MQPVSHQQGPGGLHIRWRTLEWVGVGLSLLLLSGAFIPLLLGSGGLDSGARAALRLLAAPPYVITIILVARHARQILVALRRGLPLAMLTVLPFVSVAWSTSGSITMRRAVGLLFTMALAYVVAARFTPRQLLVLVAAVFVPCMIVSLSVGIAVPSLGQMPPGAEASGMRGIFLHKNILGWYSALSIAVCVLMTIERIVPVAVGAALGLVCLACLAASASMTGMMMTVAGLALVGIVALLRRFRGASRVLFVLVLVQLGVILLFSLDWVLLPALDALGRDATLTGRVPLWTLVDREIGRHLLLGVGYQAFWTEANPDAWRIWGAIGWPAPHAHNGYRDMLLNFGLLGFVVFAAMLMRAVAQGSRLHIGDPNGGWLWLNVYFGMFLVMNLTESMFFVQNDVLFVLFATTMIMYDMRAPRLLRSAAAGRLALDPARLGAFEIGRPAGEALR